VNVHYEDDAERDALLDAAETRALDADANRTTIDGYRLDYGDAWVLVRPSGTEPVVRIYAESTDREHAEELAEAFAADLRAARANA
jgi:phosphomannomutase/phosphoglucomutase